MRPAGALACVCGVHVTAVEGAALARRLARVYGRCLCVRTRPRRSARVGRRAVTSGAITLMLAEPSFPHVEHALVVLALGSLRQVALHAAAFVVGGRLIVAVGPHGAGKTTLALAARAAGARVLADDIVLVDARGRASGLPRARLVKRPIGTRYVAPDPGVMSEVPALLVFLARGAPGSARLAPLGALEALRRLLGARFETLASEPSVVRALAAVSRRAPARELHYREAAEALALLEVA